MPAWNALHAGRSRVVAGFQRRRDLTNALQHPAVIVSATAPGDGMRDTPE